MNVTSVMLVRDSDSTNKVIDDDGLTAAASCEVVGPRERRGIITIPPTRITTLRCRPLQNSIIRDGEIRNPAPEAPVSLRAFRPPGCQNLIVAYENIWLGHMLLSAASTTRN